MNKRDEENKKLIKSIKDVLHALRVVSRGGEVDHVVASKMISLVKVCLTYLASAFDVDAPGIVYAKALIGFAIKGLLDKPLSKIWDEYYIRGRSIWELSADMYISPETVRSRIKSLPERVAMQLWEINLELAPRHRINPSTLQQRQANILEEEFSLTDREIEIMLIYAEPGEQGRQEILDERLFITENTLKTHIRHIKKKLSRAGLKTSTMNEATDKAMAVAERHISEEDESAYRALAVRKLELYEEWEQAIKKRQNNDSHTIQNSRSPD